jgi:hypothetical protein
MAWYEAAASFSEEALAELRALTPREADRAHFNELYWLFEQQTDLVRRIAVAIYVLAVDDLGDLSKKRVDLTHQKDAFEPSLQECPVSLPA